MDQLKDKIKPNNPNSVSIEFGSLSFGLTITSNNMAECKRVFMDLYAKLAKDHLENNKAGPRRYVG